VLLHHFQPDRRVHHHEQVGLHPERRGEHALRVLELEVRLIGRRPHLEVGPVDALEPPARLARVRRVEEEPFPAPAPAGPWGGRAPAPRTGAARSPPSTPRTAPPPTSTDPPGCPRPRSTPTKFSAAVCAGGNASAGTASTAAPQIWRRGWPVRLSVERLPLPP